jgi:flagellar basal-body rod modification protein FlgD
MSTTPVVPTTPTTATTTGLPSGQSLNNMFLQLLVAQLQNQDPTAPVDPSQFVGQLAQFSELSEVTSIYTLLQQETTAAAGTGSTGGSASPPAGMNYAGALPVLGAASSAPAGMPAAAGSTAASALSNFASPALSALTSKLQGAF